MLIALLILYSNLSEGGVDAAPILLCRTPSDACNDLDRCRKLRDIIWSCLATIFACTWVAVHRNIPANDSRWYTVCLEYSKIFMLALLVPEWILAWAVRQLLHARQIATELEQIAKEQQRNASGNADEEWQEVTLFEGTERGHAARSSEDGETLLGSDEDNNLALPHSKPDGERKNGSKTKKVTKCEFLTLGFVSGF